MSPRLVWAIVAIAILGGGSAAYVVWRSDAERDAAIDAIVRDVTSELASAEVETDTRLALLRRVEQKRKEIGSPRLDVAAAELLLALGRTQDAWDVVGARATALDADPDALSVGARIAMRIHAAGGDVDVGRQAFGLAVAHADRTGDAASRMIAWQLAFRLHDAAGWARQGALLAEGGDAARAALVRATAVDLAAFLADRLGIAPDAVADGAEGDAGELARGRALGDGVSRTAAELDELVARVGAPVPEAGIVAAFRILDRLAALDGEAARSAQAESLGREGLDRCGAVLDDVPTSVTARHLAVVALVGLRARFGIDDEQTARLRGHVRWLVANASDRDNYVALWRGLAAELDR